MLTLQSPAKINLFLRVLSRRADGYHDIASLFQAIDIMDTLTFEIAKEDSFFCSDPRISSDSSNLVMKALNLFRSKTGFASKFKISLQKNIPYEAGLGGGSSNAATTLWGINQFLSTPVPLTDLIKWGAVIGSDVPFFLSQGTAYCTGRGEIVYPLPLLKNHSIWIIKPAGGVSTPAVYKQLRLEQLSGRDPEKDLRDFYNGRPIYYNDLEQPALEIMPELKNIKLDLMKAGFKTVILSGSGSSFFCIGTEEPPSLPKCKIFKAKSIQRSLKSWYTL